MPKKHERPGGANLLTWLVKQEVRIAKGTMPSHRRAELETLPEWHERADRRGIVA